MLFAEKEIIHKEMMVLTGVKASYLGYGIYVISHSVIISSGNR